MAEVVESGRFEISMEDSLSGLSVTALLGDTQIHGEFTRGRLEVSGGGYISQVLFNKWHAVGFMLCSQDSEEGGQSAEHALHHAESKVRVVTCCNSRSRRSW